MLPKRIDDYSTVSREMHRVAEEIFYAHLKRVGLKRTAPASSTTSRSGLPCPPL